jgi:hypothetical protein
MRVRSPLLLDALEHVQEAALRRGVPPTFVQVGAMDGVVSFLGASSVAYCICWCTVHADYMLVYGMFVYTVYGNAEDTGHRAPST